MPAKPPDPRDPKDTFDEPMFMPDGFDDLFETHRPYGRSETGFLAGRSFKPSANIYETSDGLVITLDVPGIERKHIDIKIEGRRLMVTGARNFTRDHPDEEFVRIERGFGSFKRVFEVFSDVDHDEVKARLDNGVLTITVPRRCDLREIPVESEDSD